MPDLFSTIRRRKLLPWLGGYAAGAWVVLQVLDIVAELWGWPAIIGRIVFVALATGLGVTAVLAWFHGERGRQRPTALEVGLLAALMTGGAVAGAAVLRSGPVAGSPPGSALGELALTSLAVLPFEDLSPGGGHAYLGDGIAETLISGLSRLGSLRVVARTSAFGFRDVGDVREIGRRLGVGSIVAGTITQMGSRVRVTANLVDARSGQNVWAEKFDEEADEADLFDLQDEVARKIVEALRVRLVGANRIVGGGTRDPEAQRAFYLGQHHWTARTTEDMVAALGYFQQAIAADSTFAEAWGGLALSYTLSTPTEYAVPGITKEQALLRAEAAARRAIELDPDVVSAYAALGDASVQRGDIEAGERWLREAIARNPGYATAHHWLADLLMTTLKGEEALREMDLAESLDPVAPAILVERAEALMMLGRYVEAVAQLEKAIGLLPDALVVRLFAVEFHLVLGDWERAAENLVAAARIAGLPDEGARLGEVLLDPRRRAALFRVWVDVGPAQDDPPNPVELELLSRPELRVIAARHLDGDQAALDLLERIVSGPDASKIYPPALPAILGPELLETEQAQRIVRRARERR